jgi:hypothetical protein
MRWTVDKADQEFVIRMKDGQFYQRMIGLEIQVVEDPVWAFHFRSRRAALQVVATTHQFGGAYILPYDAPPTKPEAA